MSLTCQRSRRLNSQVIAAPTRSPVSDHDAGIKGSLIHYAVIIEAVVKGHGRHAALLHDLGKVVYIGNVIIVLLLVLQRAKSHAVSACVNIIGKLIAAHVEDRTALVAEILNIFLYQLLGKSNRSFIHDIQCTCGFLIILAICRVLNAYVLHSIHDSVHMSRRVQQRDNLDAIFVGILDNGIHLTLRQLSGMAVINVSLLDTFCYLGTIIGRITNCD